MYVVLGVGVERGTVVGGAVAAFGCSEVVLEVVVERGAVVDGSALDV